MELSAAEEAIVEVIRLAALGDMSLSITRASGVVVVTAATPEEDGLMIGAGPTLDAAVFSLAGLAAPADPTDGEPTPEAARVFRLVGGSEHRAVDAQDEMDRSADSLVRPDSGARASRRSRAGRDPKTRPPAKPRPGHALGRGASLTR